MDTNLILTNDQAAINAIRAAGADQLQVPRCLGDLLCTNQIAVFLLQVMAIQAVTPGPKITPATLPHPAL
jgi:hypothetical protein